MPPLFLFQRKAVVSEKAGSGLTNVTCNHRQMSSIAVDKCSRRCPINVHTTCRKPQVFESAAMPEGYCGMQWAPSTNIPAITENSPTSACNLPGRNGHHGKGHHHEYRFEARYKYTPLPHEQRVFVGLRRGALQYAGL